MCISINCPVQEESHILWCYGIWSLTGVYQQRHAKMDVVCEYDGDWKIITVPCSESRSKGPRHIGTHPAADLSTGMSESAVQVLWMR